MKTTLICIAAEAERDAAKENLQRLCQFYPNARLWLCVLDGDMPPAHGQAADIELFCARNLLGDSFYDKAFYFSKEELRDYCGFLLCSRLNKEQGQILWVAPTATVTHCAVPQPDEIMLPADSEKPTFAMSYVLGHAHSHRPDYLLFGNGTGVANWLSWCKKKFDWLLEQHRHIVAPEYADALRQRNFCASWWNYAGLFGCKVILQPSSPRTSQASDKEAVPYRFDFFEDGVRIFPALREYYGVNYHLQEKCAGNPFAHRSLFTDEQVLLGDTTLLKVTPAMEAIRQQRMDLICGFQNQFSQNREAFVHWYLQYGAQELSLEAAYTDAVQAAVDAHEADCRARAIDRRTFTQKVEDRLRRIMKMPQKQRESALIPQAKYPAGVNLCGFIKGDFGLGESARILATILEAAKIPYTIVDFQDAKEHTYTNQAFADKISNNFIYNINIFDTNGDGQAVFLRHVAPQALQGRYNIGYWAWELPEFPENGWEEAFAPLDEVWTCSDFTSEAIRQKSPVTVTTVPHAITMQARSSKTRTDFGLPEKPFLFLVMYDVRSFSARKNPEGAVEAYLRAFPQETDDVRLLLKLNVPPDWDGEDGLLKKLLRRSDVLTISERLSKPDLNALIRCSNAYVSLHRSEGFGLGPAEAMGLGIPAVLTNWSGNTQYMREGACCPVDYQMVEIQTTHGPYKKGCHWAEPDIEDAARQMKRLVNDTDFYTNMAIAAKKVIEEEFSPVAVGSIVRKRLNTLGLLPEEKGSAEL